MSARDITVIIPAYGPSPHLEKCLRALHESKSKAGEIIVSHSGSDDPTDWIGEHFPDVRVLHSPSRLFAGAARNRGAEHAKGEFLAFCDSDVLPSPDWLDRIAQALEEHPQNFLVGAVGIAESGGYWGVANWLCEFSEMAPWRSAGQQRGGASCNMALRAVHFQRVGGFDDKLELSEDTTLFHHLRRSGLEQWFMPSMIVGHFNNSGFAAFSRHQYNMGRGFPQARKLLQMPGSITVRYPSLSLLLWAPKLGLVSRRLLEDGVRGLWRLLMYLPALTIGTVVFAIAAFQAARQIERIQ